MNELINGLAPAQFSNLFSVLFKHKMETFKLEKEPFLFLPTQEVHLHCVLDEVCQALKDVSYLHESDKERSREALSILVDTSPDWRRNGVACFHRRVKNLEQNLAVLVRLENPLPSPQGGHIRFVWLLLSGAATHPRLDVAVEFARLAKNPDFTSALLRAEKADELFDAYRAAVDAQLHHTTPLNQELTPSGKPFGCLRLDLARLAGRYASDFSDGMKTKTVASVLFLFFACLAPAIAFGGLLSVMTEGQIGVVETIVASAAGGIVYALFAGQPLTILGSTGPVIIFMGMLYPLTKAMDIPYLPSVAWVGLWTCFLLILLTALDSCCWIRYFTRFTDEIFAALISLIFIVEAGKDLVLVFTDHRVPKDTALLSLVLALGTFGIASHLSKFRQSPYLRRQVREFLADFGPALAMAMMTVVAFTLHEVNLETLSVPEDIVTTSGRAWIVNPLDTPIWARWAAALPAALVTILVYLDQNITVRLVNSPDHKLKKGSGYHLDLLLVGLLIGAFSLFGLPWMVAATVRSLNHVRSLATNDTGTDRVVGVIETRLSGLLVHLLLACSLFLLQALAYIPMSVLFGLFLYMGVASMTGNTFFERLRLWVMDPLRFPTDSIIRAIPARTVHRYTLVQLFCLIVLWIVKASPLGLLFPIFIALLVPVRQSLEGRFRDEHLALLDAEEEPEEEPADISYF